jgi:hypothetical protein
MTQSDRDESRQFFFTAWQKHLTKTPVEPLEAQIIEIILQHPEYHDLLSHPENNQNKDFTQDNPFLHMGLHLALREQISTNRPAGIQAIYQTLIAKHGDTLYVEHQMMECLAMILWQSQRSSAMPSEEQYLENLKKLT